MPAHGWTSLSNKDGYNSLPRAKMHNLLSRVLHSALAGQLQKSQLSKPEVPAVQDGHRSILWATEYQVAEPSMALQQLL